MICLRVALLSCSFMCFPFFPFSPLDFYQPHSTHSQPVPTARKKKGPIPPCLGPLPSKDPPQCTAASSLCGAQSLIFDGASFLPSPGPMFTSRNIRVLLSYRSNTSVPLAGFPRFYTADSIVREKNKVLRDFHSLLTESYHIQGFSGRRRTLAVSFYY
ncbi:hypothetical protein BKA59DRAFT_103412 [Fusarium tricinctum]|uniref:Secreted protein n=1 Tax=Fusarium tricinctum TaxID=61284 RepID=A0A8K0S6N7_9HYPO|nr:hypothetical protein BKA59DRAFT_103412 [Fusarium tricinctum]